jgi:hypothetical protein
LPVPVSPVIKTGVVVGATLLIANRARYIWSDLPNNLFGETTTSAVADIAFPSLIYYDYKIQRTHLKFNHLTDLPCVKSSFNN